MVKPFKFAGINVRILGSATYSREFQVRSPAVEQMSLKCHYMYLLGYRHFRENLISWFFKNREISEIKFHTNISTYTVF